MKEIKLTNNQNCFVSEEDYEKVSQYKWNSHRDYAVTKIDGKYCRMHHMILGTPQKGYIIDHINRNPLDNRRENLRFATKSENNQNRTNSNKYQGISLSKGKWRVICKHEYFGCFEKDEDAAIHYDKVAFLLFGENAKTNNLVKFKEVRNLKLEDLRPKKEVRELPANICYFHNEKYEVRMIYNKKVFRKRYISSLEEAITVKEQFSQEIEKIKEHERLQHLNREIERNEEGLAVIKIKDKTVIIDDDLWHDYVKKVWYINNSGYVAVSISKLGYLMHRLVMGITETNVDVLVDHINRNRLDNRRCNLRIVDALLNSHNTSKKRDSNSKFYGVSKCGIDKWDSKITCNGKTYYLGKFTDELFAADAYNRKAIELFGENARLNQFTEIESEHVNKNENNHIYDIKTNPTIKNHNKQKKSGTSSIYTGVHKKGKKWQAAITYKGEKQHLGTYTTEREAAQAYNDVATRLYGEHANLNKFE